MSNLEITLEFASLRSPGHCPIGVWVIPSPTNVYLWEGVLFIHRGYYAGAIYRFIIDIPITYPNESPKIRFKTDCFHPLVDPNTGRFDIRSRFSNWRPHIDFIFHLLHFLKGSFKRAGLERLKNEDEVQNKEAFRLYRDQTQVFANLASQSAILSASSPSLESDSNESQLIKFSNLDDQEWQSIRTQILGHQTETNKTTNPKADVVTKKVHHT
ncbi:hypothetical protein CROQUDRAFT_93652 [Cronartium quercuum f. sp. fusiforme G11]|uniref:UBC core domain-containing protein n=1 Tax=Cronartium quercuum f. sp. fusiforme G11 TaxID=708437 RepID=A0A9P6NK61_9BASI|nr:hypothetical protein CROQUDRAFT_93652 [Cronartium quercuum f. sp. fusiforme G11]